MMTLLCNTMFGVFIFFATLAASLAGFAGTSTNNVDGGNSVGYGFSGSFSGNGFDVPAPNIPFPNFGGNFQNFDFSNIAGYVNSLQKYHEHFIKTPNVRSFAIIFSSSPNANVQAKSSITFKNNGLQEQAQQAQTTAGGSQGQNNVYAPAFNSYQGSPGNFPSDGGAIAAASLGPQGGSQTAAVFPENLNSPNIFTRFSETAPNDGANGQSYGVFTSSVSSSSNVDGKPQNFHQASTTINDNGKVTTYTVKNP